MFNIVVPFTRAHCTGTDSPVKKIALDVGQGQREFHSGDDLPRACTASEDVSPGERVVRVKTGQDGFTSDDVPGPLRRADPGKRHFHVFWGLGFGSPASHAPRSPAITKQTRVPDSALGSEEGDRTTNATNEETLRGAPRAPFTAANTTAGG